MPVSDRCNIELGGGHMRINEAAELSKLPKKTIKYYEEENLIIPDRNSANNYREYNEDHIRVLREIKLLRKLGFTIDNIRMILNHPKELKRLFEQTDQEVAKKLFKLSDKEMKKVVIGRKVVNRKDINTTKHKGFGIFIRRIC